MLLPWAHPIAHCCVRLTAALTLTASLSYTHGCATGDGFTTTLPRCRPGAPAWLRPRQWHDACCCRPQGGRPVWQAAAPRDGACVSAPLLGDSSRAARRRQAHSHRLHCCSGAVAMWRAMPACECSAASCGALDVRAQGCCLSAWPCAQVCVSSCRAARGMLADGASMTRQVHYVLARETSGDVARYQEHSSVIPDGVR